MPRGRELYNLATFIGKALAILSTFELVLSCILTLLHLIEQSHTAALRFVCSFIAPVPHFLCPRVFMNVCACVFHPPTLSLHPLTLQSHLFSRPLSFSLFLSSVVIVVVAFSEVFILQTPCLYLLLARWPELSRTSLTTEILCVPEFFTSYNSFSLSFYYSLSLSVTFYFSLAVSILTTMANLNNWAH